MTKIKSTDWQSLPIADWNVATFLAFICDRTRELYGVEYAPGGSGAKQARWNRERGMLKNAQARYGNAVLRKFIEICWREYRTSKPELYPYPTVTFMLAYMDRHFAEAQAKVVRKENVINYEELEEWL